MCGVKRGISLKRSEILFCTPLDNGITNVYLCSKGYMFSTIGGVKTSLAMSFVLRFVYMQLLGLQRGLLFRARRCTSSYSGRQWLQRSKVYRWPREGKRVQHSG